MYGAVSQTVLTWTMGVGFIVSFLLTGYHAHFLLHLGLGQALVAMFVFVGAVLAGLLVNLWFMAGQRSVLQFLAFWEPTSSIAEWVHDTVFGVSQERIDAAYAAGAHRGRRTQDGKSYVQLIIPRRRIPHPCSLGGLLHFCFFSADDPFDSDQCIAQILRSLIVLSFLVLVSEASVLEWLYHSDALLTDAVLLQNSGHPEEAIDKYQDGIMRSSSE